MRKLAVLWLIPSLCIALVGSFSLVTPSTRAQIGLVKNYYAVIIGIADYWDNPTIVDLNYADDDAVAFYNTLLAWGWNPWNIWLLLSTNPMGFGPILTPPLGIGPGFRSDPTRDNIVAALTWLQTNSTNNDKVLIYYSGHGGKEPDPGPDNGGDEVDFWDETIVPQDAGVGVPPVPSITDDEFRNMLANIEGEIDVILDSCYSGGFAGSGTPTLPGPHLTWNNHLSDAPEDIGDDPLLKERTVVLASSLANENSFEDATANLFPLPPGGRVLHPWRNPPYWGHGLFTDLLLAGLNRIPGGVAEADLPPPPPGLFGNGNRQVSAEEAFWYIEAIYRLTAGLLVPPVNPLPPNIFISEALHGRPANNRLTYSPGSAGHPEMWDGNDTDSEQTFLFTLNVPAVAERFGPRVDHVLIKTYAAPDVAFQALEDGEVDVADLPLSSYWIDRWSQPPFSDEIQLEWYADTGVKAYRKEYGSWAGEERYEGKQWLGFLNLSGFGVNSLGTFLNAHTQDWEKGGVIRYGFTKDIWMLNPIHSWTYWDWQALDKIYDTLIKYDADDLNVIPWMAKSYTVGTWDSSGNLATKVTFKLHENILWHDNTHFTSADVAFTIEYTNDAYFPEPADWSPFWYPMVSNVDHVDTPDAFTVEIYFNALSNYGVHLIGDLPIIPKHIWESIPPEMSRQNGEYETTGMLTGSGPFRFVDKGDTVTVLEANPTYFRKLVRPDYYSVGNPIPTHDGDVDIDDFGIAVGHFGCAHPWPHPVDQWADVNKDLTVDLDDLMEIGVRYQRTGYYPYWNGYPNYYAS